jgi:hypothetical protein
MKSFMCGVFALLLTCGPVQADELAITKGGSNYATGLAIGKTTGLIPIPFSGTTTYMHKINSEQLSFGISNPSQLYWAYNGKEMFNGKELRNLRFVANLQEFRPVVMVRASSDLYSVSDLRGMRIPSEFRGAPLFQKNFTDVLSNGGLTWDDVIPVPVATYKGQVTAFEKGRTDVVKSTLGGGASRKLNATIRGGLRMLCMNPDGGEYNPKTGLIEGSEYSKAWPGQNFKEYSPHPTTPTVKGKCIGISYNYTIWAHKNVPNKVVFDVVSALYNDHQVFRSASKLTSEFDRENMANYDRIPMHEGAKSAYKVLGLR